MRHLPFILLAFWSVIGANSFAQNYKFVRYGANHEFPNSFIYSINQDERGYIWIGTGEGLLRFNGINFKVIYQGDSLAENSISTSFQDQRQNIWFGHKNGGLTKLKDESFIIPDIGDDIPAGTITTITTDPQGSLWYTIQGGGVVKRIDRNKYLNFTSAFGNSLVYDIEFISAKEFLAATNKGLSLFKINHLGFPVKVRDLQSIPSSNVNTVNLHKNYIYVGTQSEGLFRLPLSANITRTKATKIGLQCGLNQANVKDIFFDSNNNMWVSTYGHGLIKGLYSQKTAEYNEFLEFKKTTSFTAENINLVFEDRESNLWIGTAGEGIVKLEDQFFELYTYSNILKDNNIYCIQLHDHQAYLGTNNGIIHEDRKSGRIQLLSTQHGLPDDRITCLFLDNKSTLWVGSATSGVYYRASGEEEFQRLKFSEDNLSNSINAISGSKQFIYFATKFGLYQYNRISKKFIKYSTENELRHNDISHLVKDKTSSDVWIATKSNYLTKIRAQEITDYEIIKSNIALNISSIELDKYGNVWMATYGDGIYMYDYQGFEHFTMKDGIKSDYCYGITLDQTNNIWVTHRGGLTKINSRTNNIKTYGPDDGFNADCNKNAIAIDNNQNIWFGTDKGLVKYNPERDKLNNIPPITNMLKVIVTSNNEDKVYNPGEDIDLPSGAYKIKFEFIGLSFKDTEGLTYEYILDGYDLDTNYTSANFAQYNRLEEGAYSFKVRACNADGYCSTSTINTKIEIEAPFWKKTWFLASTSGGLLLLIFGFIRYRDQRQKSIQRFLKKELDARTAEVVQKKDELELKNKDITDSINYAKRIQNAILPELDLLNEHLPDSFIFFRPRDIVSGDFYWYSKYEEKFLIACSDATGHGVPGAFMSIIGSTILQDTLSKKEIESPSEVLYRLDAEVKNLLSKKDNTNSPRDGMDISVCEIDLKTRVARIASAMRPTIIFKNGEENYLKGDRHPVGGGFSEEKEFNTHTFKLNKGDIIYMFSDGYPDQFGGPKGKKFKQSRLRDIFRFMHSRPAHFQEMNLANNLDKWMDNKHPQIDDIIIMGIRL